MSDVVIVSATRTPVGCVQRRVRQRAGACARPDGDQERAGAGRGRSGRGVRGDPGPDPDRQSGPEPGAPGLDPCRRAEGGAGLRRNILCGSGLKSVAWASRRSRTATADRGRRRPGEHEPWRRTAPTCAAAPKMGGVEFLDTMLKDGLWMRSTATTWAPRPRTSPRSGRSPARSRTSSRSPRRTRPRRRIKAGRFKDEITPVTIQTRKGDVVVDTDEYPALRRHPRRHGQAAPGVQQGRHGDRRQRLGHQRRRRGRWC